jgi:hypothetical protein
MVNDLQEICDAATRNGSIALSGTPQEWKLEAAAEFIAAATDVGAYDTYKIFPKKARDLIDEIRTRSGEAACRRFLRHVLAQTVIGTVGSERFRRLPPRVAAQQARQLARIAANSDNDSEWLRLDHDLFQKEFGIASMRLYAAGAQLVDFRCGIPRSVIWRGGAAGSLFKLRSILQTGGFRPYFEIHTHEFMLDGFNEQGWNECYHCCSELYALHPEVRGMFGASWFYDPSLSRVSPRLAYLQEIPTAGGARLFFFERGGSAINNSLSTSPTRRKLYEEGKYFPQSYMLAWGKAAQIAWSKNFLATHAA